MLYPKRESLLSVDRCISLVSKMGTWYGPRLFLCHETDCWVMVLYIFFLSYYYIFLDISLYIDFGCYVLLSALSAFIFVFWNADPCLSGPLSYWMANVIFQARLLFLWYWIALGITYFRRGLPYTPLPLFFSSGVAPYLMQLYTAFLYWYLSGVFGFVCIKRAGSGY